jgi:hypothetical protein
VGNTIVILVFQSSTTCHTLVHEFGHDQLNTTKELLGIATWHASGEEAVQDAFVLGDGKMVVATARQRHPRPPARALRAARRAKAPPGGSQSLLATMMMTMK